MKRHANWWEFCEWVYTWTWNVVSWTSIFWGKKIAERIAIVFFSYKNKLTRMIYPAGSESLNQKAVVKPSPFFAQQSVHTEKSPSTLAVLRAKSDFLGNDIWMLSRLLSIIFLRYYFLWKQSKDLENTIFSRKRDLNTNEENGVVLFLELIFMPSGKNTILQ